MHTNAVHRSKALAISCWTQAIIHFSAMLGALYALSGKMFITVKADAGIFQFMFGTDYTTIFFFILISILGLLVGIYSYGYLKEYQNIKHFNIFLVLYNIFTISLYFVTLSRDIISFLLFWELMSVTSYFLVILEGSKQEILKSGLMYFVMTHIGTVFIILAFFMLYKSTGSLYFKDFYAYNFDNKTLLIILILAFVGFGTKAGVFPLHVWLPKAHPAAPANVSALMSGAMIKMGIYGIIRVCFDFPSTYILGFGFLLLAAGILSAVIGITHALVQSDIKKFLAYSSIENIGIIILALGISYICYSRDLNAVGSVALLAAFIHMLNHGIFKAILFMGAGNVLYSTGTRNIEQMGGLIKKMPKTSCFFLIAALSACALPPLNGFIGEWFIYKSVIYAAAGLKNMLLGISVAVGGVALAFTGALAAYGFVKVFGIAFLGLPRSHEVENAVEVPRSMTIPMGVLSFLCFVIGIYPGLILGFIKNITAEINQACPIAYRGSVIVISNTGLSIIAAVIIALTAAAILAVFIESLKKKHKSRIYETWDCGFEGLNSRMQFSGQGYIKSFNRVLSGTFVVNKKVEYTKGRLTSDGIRYEIDISDNVEKSIYTPIRQLVKIVAKKTQKLQQGLIQAYLAYVFAVIVLLMIFYL